MSTAGRILTGRDHTVNTTLHCDVVVVGSGAGGRCLAERLTARGLNVVMLEEGGYCTRGEFDLREDHCLSPPLPGDGQPGDGRPVGAHPPGAERGRRDHRELVHLLPHAAARAGALAATITGCRACRRRSWSPHWEAIEKRLHIAEWPLEPDERNNRVLWDGCGKLGYSRGLIRRNVNNCANLGYCGLGCPLDAKQSMLVTLIPDAVEKGMTVHANASVRRLLVGNGGGWAGSRRSCSSPPGDRPAHRCDASR